jgi:xanthine dioxygenase
MAPARAMSTGLGIESEGRELPLDELPEWEKSKVKFFPMVTLSYFTVYPTCSKWFSGVEKPSDGQSSLPSPSMRYTCCSHRPSAKGRFSWGCFVSGWSRYHRFERGQRLGQPNEQTWYRTKGMQCPRDRNIIWTLLNEQYVYPHDWEEKDLVIFDNRGVLHTVVGAFEPDQVRAFHQCNLAASDDPVGPSVEDIAKWG